MIKYLSLTALLLGVPAMGQIKPVAVEQIFETYNACYAAMPAQGIDSAKLEALGCQLATSSSPAIKDIFLYGHTTEKRGLILLSAQSGSGICIVTAKLEKYKDYKKFLTAFGDKLPKPNADGETLFKSGGRLVIVSRTGSRKEPAMRIAVTTSTEN